jgi:predicted secreted protein
MLRSGLLAAALAMMLPATAFAGDAADREIIGFSPDAGVFAFEEYGVEDGSGFPYSNIYVINVDTDGWIDGTPIRVRLEEDGASLEAARQEAKALAQPFLDDHSITPDYNLLASNPVTELTENPREMKFVTHPHLKDSGQWWFAALDEKQMPAPSCPEMENEPFQGFSLTLVDPDGQRQTLHDDERIPASRKCPMSYTLSDVITAYPENGEPALVVLVNSFNLGFEGANRRFIAVTTRFKG